MSRGGALPRSQDFCKEAGMDSERPKSDEGHGEVERVQRDKPWQRYLEAELGLRNYWYPVLFSHELNEGDMRPETILGERLFLKRIDGKVYCIEDRCLHRGWSRDACHLHSVH